MSIAFSVAVYLAAGLAIAVWLAGQDRLPSNPAVRAATLLFWPAYLPICLSPRSTPAHDPALDGLRRQIERLPIDASRRAEYQSAVDRLAGALEQRKKELARLSHAEERLGQLGGSFGGNGKPLVDAELERVQRAKQSVDHDIARAREGMLKLALRLELIDLGGTAGNLDVELSSLEEEIGRLLEARDEAAKLS